MPGTPTQPHLRPPVAADYDALPGWVPDAAACHRWAGPDLPFPFSGADLPRLIAKPGAVSLVLAREGRDQALGFGQFWVQQPGAVHLGRIILAPEVRGQGLGPVLCNLLIAEAIRVTSAPAVTLKVHRDNPVAHAIYARLGFVEVSSLSTDAVIFLHAQGNRCTCGRVTTLVARQYRRRLAKLGIFPLTQFLPPMLSLFLKCLMGAVAVLAIALLSRSKSFFIAGLIPLFPTFALIAHYIVGSERSIADLRTTALFGLWSLIPYAVYLLAVYWLSVRTTLTVTLASATLAWLFAAVVLVLVWGRYYQPAG